MAAVPLPRSSPALRSCPGCGRQPSSVMERRVLAEELATPWLLVEGGPTGATVVVRWFCLDVCAGWAGRRGGVRGVRGRPAVGR